MVAARGTILQAAGLFLRHAHEMAKTSVLTMIFLLGGPPRVGKSIISSKIRQKHAVSVVSTDTLGAVLELGSFYLDDP